MAEIRKKIVEEKGLVQISDPEQLKQIVNEILDQNEQSIIDFKDGKKKSKRLPGRANYESNKRPGEPAACKSDSCSRAREKISSLDKKSKKNR